MSLTKLTENLNNISSLPDKPSLRPEELKEIFDKSAKDIKEYINSILTEEIDELIEKINREKASQSHSSQDKIYGLGTETDYGHTKVINNLNSLNYSEGESLSAKQGSVLKEKIEEVKNDTDDNEEEINRLIIKYGEMEEQIVSIHENIAEIFDLISKLSQSLNK